MAMGISVDGCNCWTTHGLFPPILAAVGPGCWLVAIADMVLATLGIRVGYGLPTLSGLWLGTKGLFLGAFAGTNVWRCVDDMHVAAKRETCPTHLIIGVSNMGCARTEHETVFVCGTKHFDHGEKQLKTTGKNNVCLNCKHWA